MSLAIRNDIVPMDVIIPKFPLLDEIALRKSVLVLVTLLYSPLRLPIPVDHMHSMRIRLLPYPCIF